jgi:DtxR family Mn-dependent transcriptional regulator
MNPTGNKFEMDLHERRPSQPLEEALEAAWTAMEAGENSLERLRADARAHVSSELLSELERDGWLSIASEPESGERFALTAKGLERARAIIRRHRLAERLVTDVLHMEPQNMEDAACAYEHLVADTVTESICILLAHPQTCPHGKPIPPGQCCLRARSESVRSQPAPEGLARPEAQPIIPLDAAPPGKSLRVAFIAAQSPARLERLSAYGLTAGSVIRLVQTSPAFVVECEQTQIAMERDIAREIHVVPLEP